MAEIKQDPKRFAFDIYSPVIGVIALGVSLCGISLVIIGIRIGPLVRQASIWNGCVDTTQDFLSELPNFVATDAEDLKAMSVNLCNGSTPQRVESPSR